MWVSYISLEAIAHRLTGGKKGLKRSSAPRTGFSSMKSYQKDTVVQEAQRLVEADEKKEQGRMAAWHPHRAPGESLKSTGKHSHLDLFLGGGSHQDSTVQGRPLSLQRRGNVSS